MQKNLIYYFISAILLALYFAWLFVARDTFFGMDALAWVYLVFSSLHHASTLMLVPLLIGGIVHFAARRCKGNTGLWAMALATAVLFSLVWIDGRVYDLYRFHINGIVLGMVFSPEAGQIFHFGTGMIAGSVVRILIVFGFFMALAFLILKNCARAFKWYLIAILWVGVALTAQGLNMYGAAIRHQRRVALLREPATLLSDYSKSSVSQMGIDCQRQSE